MYVCKYHKNFIMAVNTLNKEFGHIIPKYDHDLAAKLVCASATDDCWFNRCPTCSDAKLARGMFLLEESNLVLGMFLVKMEMANSARL